MALQIHLALLKADEKKKTCTFPSISVLAEAFPAQIKTNTRP